MRQIKRIFIHHSASEYGDAKTIDFWHKELGWSEIGYHFVVLNGYSTNAEYKNNIINENLIGTIEKGRSLKDVGSHVKGHNQDSIGICLIHLIKEYPEKQLESYRDLTASLCEYFNIDSSNVFGHYEFDPKKPLCPGLDMNKEREIIKQKLINSNFNKVKLWQ